MPANYNNAAWFYDRLAAVVYGDSLNRAQQHHLHYIPASSKILIVGGGTGKILEEISNIYPSGLQITYVEIAPKMTAFAKKRNIANNQIEFIVAPVEDVSLSNNFDVVITPFLFDNFKVEMVHRLFNHIEPALKSNGIWLNTDFHLTGKWWQSILLKSMMLFFWILCGVESKELQDMDAIFRNASYSNLDQKTFYGDFIISTAYRKA